MNVSGIEFIVPVLAGAAVYYWLSSVRLRQAAWACCNALALWLLIPNLASAATLAVFLVSGYLVARILTVRPSGTVLAAYLALLVSAFLVLKQYDFLRYLLPDHVFEHPIRIVGLSYMLFRQIHFLVDASQGQIERPSFWDYANYQLSLFTILAGPIQRFEDFQEQWRSLDPILTEPGDLLLNCLRLFAGIFKLALIAPFFSKGWINLLPNVISPHGLTGWKLIVDFLVVFYFYPIYLYFNFSGYCDIVIAANRFFGMRLPENFNRPYLARNVLEFWTRWHITLGTWIRDYLFLSMYKPIAERWPKRAPSLAFLCYFFAFVVAGVWHGSTMNFLVFGVFQGVGASAGKLWENRILRRGGREGLRNYLKNRWIRYAAIAVQLNFQCLAMMYFASKDISDTNDMVRNLALAVRSLLPGH